MLKRVEDVLECMTDTTGFPGFISTFVMCAMVTSLLPIVKGIAMLAMFSVVLFAFTFLAEEKECSDS